MLWLTSSIILDRGIKGTVSQESLKTKVMAGKIMSCLRAAKCYDFSGNGNVCVLYILYSSSKTDKDISKIPTDSSSAGQQLKDKKIMKIRKKKTV